VEELYIFYCGKKTKRPLETARFFKGFVFKNLKGLRREQ